MSLSSLGWGGFCILGDILPWTKEDVDEFKKGLTESQKERWVEVANDVLERCLDNGGDQKECEAEAVQQANGVVGEMSDNKVSTFKICAHAKTEQIRTEHWNGKKWKVAPVVAVAEGVLKGKFLPGEEIRNTATLWEDSPLPVMHPEEAGRKTTARSLDVIEEDVIGRLYNVEVEDKKLKGELWVDIEKAREKGGEYEQVLDILENNEQLEVSTGFYSFPEPQSGNYEGEHYNMVHRNVIPDHLSLLPNAEGECSWADGCGAPRINSAGDYMDTSEEWTYENYFENRLNVNASRPDYDGTEDIPWSNVDKTFGGFKSALDIDQDKSWEELTDNEQDRIDGHFIDQSGDTFSEKGYPVVNPNTGNLNRGAVANAKSRASGEGDGDVESIANSLWDEEFEEPETEISKSFFNNMLDKFTNRVEKIFRGENPMSRDELVENLAEKMEVEESEFEEWDDEKLNFLADKYNFESDDEEDNPDEPETNESEKTEDNDNEEEEMEMSTNKLKDFLEDDEVKGVLESLVEDKVSERENEDEKEDLIDTITTNAEEVEKDELEDKDVDSLRTMASLVKPANYSGVGGPRDNGSEDMDLEWLENREERIRGEE